MLTWLWKRERFATFAISMVDLCLLQQCKWSKIKIRLPRLIIYAPYRSNFITFLTFSSFAEQTSRCREVILAVGDALQLLLPLWEGLNKSQCMDCLSGQNMVAFLERLPLVEFRLSLLILVLLFFCQLPNPCESRVSCHSPHGSVKKEGVLRLIPSPAVVTVNRRGKSDPFSRVHFSQAYHGDWGEAPGSQNPFPSRRKAWYT